MRYCLPEPHPSGVEAKLKVLRGVTVFCQRTDCERHATHLFRIGTGSIASYCELHAEVVANGSGIELPTETPSGLPHEVVTLPEVE